MSFLKEYIENHDISINLIKTLEIEVVTINCIKDQLRFYCEKPFNKTLKFNLFGSEKNEVLISVECQSREMFQLRNNGEFEGYFKNAKELFDVIESIIKSLI